MLGDDIVRGLRVGGILLALLFGGVAAYRISREVPREIPHDPPPPPKRARPAAAARDIWSGPAIPPPPPARRAANRVAAPLRKPPVVKPPAAKTEDPPASAVENPPVVAKPAPAAVEPVIAIRDSEDEPAAKPESRAKRAIKAVGRFLRLVPQPQYVPR